LGCFVNTLVFVDTLMADEEIFSILGYAIKSALKYYSRREITVNQKTKRVLLK
jgi:hypothetical protein